MNLKNDNGCFGLIIPGTGLTGDLWPRGDSLGKKTPQYRWLDHLRDRIQTTSEASSLTLAVQY